MSRGPTIFPAHRSCVLERPRSPRHHGPPVARRSHRGRPPERSGSGTALQGSGTERCRGQAPRCRGSAFGADVRTALAWQSASSGDRVGPSSTMNATPSSGELVAGPRGGDAGVRPAGDSAHRPVRSARRTAAGSGPRVLRRADHVQVLVVPDRDVRAELGDEVHDRLGLRFAGGPVPAYWLSPGTPIGPQLYGEVAVEVDAVRRSGGPGRPGRRGSSTRRARARRRRGAGVAEFVDDRRAVVLVAVDHPDHQHRRPPGSPTVRRRSAAPFTDVRARRRVR